MEPEDLSKEVSLKITVGHLFLAWETLSAKFSEHLQWSDDFSEDEKRAIWGLQDILERALVENGLGNMPRDEWEALYSRAREFAVNIPVDCLD